MKKDIEFPAVKGVAMAVVRKPSEENDQVYEWSVYLLNNNDFALTNVLIASKGYGTNAAGEQQRTSTLRHFIEEVAANDYALIEPIDPSVFHLCNEYWVTYYVGNFGKQIYDKKFLFLPDSIVETNLQFIQQLESQGILHV